MNSYEILGILILIVMVLFIFTIETLKCEEQFQNGNINYSEKEYNLMLKSEEDIVKGQQVLGLINQLQYQEHQNNIRIINEIITNFMLINDGQISVELHNFISNNIGNKLMNIGTSMGELQRYARNNNIELKDIPINTDALVIDPVVMLKNKIINSSYQNKSQKQQDEKLIKLYREMKYVNNLLKTLD